MSRPSRIMGMNHFFHITLWRGIPLQWANAPKFTDSINVYLLIKYTCHSKSPTTYRFSIEKHNKSQFSKGKPRGQ